MKISCFFELEVTPLGRLEGRDPPVPPVDRDERASRRRSTVSLIKALHPITSQLVLWPVKYPIPCKHRGLIILT
jgi:hypothetical protein